MTEVQTVEFARHRALGRVLSELERTGRRPPIPSTTPIPRIVGVTGPAGAGKSTLVSSLIGQIRTHGQSVAALLVDPSSPVHGGAFLGDRVRLKDTTTDADVFVRSVATRGAYGGGADLLPHAIPVLAAAGFEWIVIETIGIGQSDVAVAELVDTTVLVFTPESGDAIQTEKSGVIELADILVVNKSDREGAQRMVGNLRARTQQRTDDTAIVPVVAATATSGDGIDELWSLLNDRPRRESL